MDITLSQDEVMAAMARDFPREYQIAVLTVANAQQARRIAELERRIQATAQPVQAPAADPAPVG